MGWWLEGAVVTVSLWRPRVGDRVAVRKGVGSTPECEELPHDAAEAGHIGRVVGDRAEPDAPGYPFLVVFDARVPTMTVGASTIRLVARHYAADELESIE